MIFRSGGSSKKFTNGWFTGTVNADKLALDDSDNDESVTFSAHATTTSYTIKMSNKGTADQILKISSVGGDNVNLAWADDATARPVAPGTPTVVRIEDSKEYSTVSGALQKLSKLNQ